MVDSHPRALESLLYGRFTSSCTGESVIWLTHILVHWRVCYMVDSHPRAMESLLYGRFTSSCTGESAIWLTSHEDVPPQINRSV